MKTAISVPDDTFEQAEQRAAELGVSRSELFTTAMREYLKQLDRKSLTERINESLDLVGQDDSDRDAAAAGRRFAQQEDDDW